MPIRTLPARPSLKHLKNEAKQLHQAIAAGDADAAVRARTNLRRLSEADPVNDVTLQEAQHVLGREYGFHDWQGLAAAAELTFEGLVTLSDASLQVVMPCIQKNRLIVALAGASDDVKRRAFGGLTDNVRQVIAAEIGSGGQVPEHEAREAQEGILQQIRLAATSGLIGWPPGVEVPPPPSNEPTIAAAARRWLQKMSVEEVRRFVHDLSARQQAHGIMSFSATVEAAVDRFVWETLRISVDGTEPDLVEDLMLTRARAMLQSFHNRLMMTIEACASLLHEVTPRIVEHKLLCIYKTSFSSDIPASGETVEELRERLRQQPITTLDLDGFASILVHLSVIAWRRGRGALAEIVDDLADDLFVQAGVRLVVEGVAGDELVQNLEARIPSALEAYGVRYHLFVAGFTAILKGHTGAALDAAMDADWARGQTMKWFPPYGQLAPAT